MNSVVLMGRITKDPVIKQGQTMKIARYTLAVDRRQKTRDGERQADFISIVSFDKAAEFAEKYLHKGTKIAIHGRITTGSYTNQAGNKVYTTEVVTDDVEFAESKKSQEQGQPEGDFVDAPDDVPFT